MPDDLGENGPLYRIRDWNNLYENHRSRELKKLDWVPMPNRHDGAGYAEFLDHPNGAAHFGVWCAIVQVASRCDVRGVLSRGDARPHDAASLARMIRMPVEIVEEALERLVKTMRWIEEVQVADLKGLTETSRADATSREKIAGRRDKAPLERNGTEQNGTEKKTRSIDCTTDEIFDIVFDDALTETVRLRANRLGSSLPVRDKRDRRLVLLAAVMVERGMLPESVVENALEGLQSAKPANPMAYFRKCLVTQAERQGLDFHDAETRVELPKQLLEVRGRDVSDDAE